MAIATVESIDSRHCRLTLGILATCLVAKIGFDASGMSLTLTDLPGQVGVAWQAHLLAIALGAGGYFVQRIGAAKITAPI